MSDVKETAKIVLAEVARAQQFTEAKQIGEVFLSAETIVSGPAYLTGPLVDAEQAYRIKRVKFMNDGMSAAAAETHAKATDEYAHYKKLEHVYELGREQVMLLKRFGPLLQAEYQRS